MLGQGEAERKWVEEKRGQMKGQEGKEEKWKLVKEKDTP